MLSVKYLDLADARRLLDAAADRSHEIGVPMCIAVTDGAGNLIAFERMDGAKVTSISIAIDKAFTAGAARNATSFYREVSQPGKAAWGISGTNNGRFCVVGGGLPIAVDGTVVGAIGLSGGTAEEDEEVARGALERVDVAGETVS
jgi:uncharacterized protein GlcG (DUF336 family)